jgi:hypothetical protein
MPAYLTGCSRHGSEGGAGQGEEHTEAGHALLAHAPHRVQLEQHGRKSDSHQLQSKKQHGHRHSCWCALSTANMP